MPAQLRALPADITTLEVDAIVNAANSTLLGGGGVDGAQVGAVRAAASADGGAEAWFVVDRGLVLEGFPARGQALELGDACAPRFDRGGRLWFDRAADDGHRELRLETFVVDPGASLPRRPAPGERPPRPSPPSHLLAGGPIRVCIDPGHGGSDPGTTGFGYAEKDIVLDVALHLRDYLLADTADPGGGGQWEVLRTRTSDVTVSLAARVDMANAWPAHRFVPIHAKGFHDPAANGTETFSFQEGTAAAALRDRIQAWMLAVWQLTDRGTKTAAFYVLVNTAMPAALGETGFMTSPIDIQKISDPVVRRELALAHLFALLEHYGISPYEPFAPPSTYCEAKQTSAGCLPSIGWSGSPSLSGPDDLQVLAAQVMGGQFGTLFWGLSPDAQPFGGGLRCVAPPLVRTPVQTSSGGPRTGTFSFHFSQAYMQFQCLFAGTTVYAQYWFRDPGHPPPQSIGLTQGLSFTLAP